MTVHTKVFGEVRPVTTMFEMSQLCATEMHVQIEAVAVVTDGER